MSEPGVKAASATGDSRDRKQPTKPEIEIVHHPAGIDLPGFGHVSYRTLGLYGGLAACGVAGVIEWPVVAAVGATYALARR